MSITIKTSGNFSKTFEYLNKLQNFNKDKLMSILKKYGEEGVTSLSKMTPRDTGETASKWRYDITVNNGSAKLAFLNDAENEGIPIAILIQYGHGTGTGGYVAPNDFINPAMQPIFKKIADDAWKEVRAI